MKTGALIVSSKFSSGKSSYVFQQLSNFLMVLSKRSLKKIHLKKKRWIHYVKDWLKYGKIKKFNMAAEVWFKMDTKSDINKTQWVQINH